MTALNTLSTLDTAQLLTLAAALGWASGLRLYAVLFIVGACGFAGWVELPPGLRVLASPGALGLCGFMLAMEFFADKIPLVDSVWDLVHALLRVPAGAALAAGVVGLDAGTLTLLAGALGGTLALSSQAAKTASRAAINTSPEPFSNVGASLAEDGLVLGMLWLAWTHPLLAAGALALAALLGVLLVVVLARFVRAAWRRATSRGVQT